MPSASPVEVNENFRHWLQKEFTDKCRNNPRYSLRSFARLLDTDPSSVSQILAGKRRVSTKAIQKICGRLSLSPEISTRLLEGAPAPNVVQTASLVLLSADAFAVIADWYHYAILELTHTVGFKSDPRWIAAKLGITPSEAGIAIDRLERLELLKRYRGQLKKSHGILTNFREGVTAPALREFQRQVLQKALHSIDYVAPEEKDITSMTMAVNVDLIPEARKRARAFRRELCDFLCQGPRTKVYNLGVQLYPVSKATNQKELDS
ncbi:MAG: TIGR02147 family protein [Proteobacteria bacterium]|nr:MAG: TIGR02147 family protein [Pseudomonadota bacterium]